MEADSPPAETAPPEEAEAPSGPKRSWRGRMDLGLCLLLTAVVLISHVWPQSFGDESRMGVRIGWALSLVQMLGFHVGLLGVAGLGFAAVRRSRELAFAALPLVALGLGPWVWSLRPRAAAEVKGPELKVATANLLMINDQAEPEGGIVGELLTADPEILVLEEYSPRWHKAFVASAIYARYPYRRWAIRQDSFGLAVYSKRPLLGPPNWALKLGEGDLPQMRFEVEHAGQRVAIYAIHLLPPRRFDYTVEHRRQFADLVQLLEAEQLPTVLAGDFNFTERSPYASRLEELGFVDTLDVQGQGRETTWPVLESMAMLPGLRLDHVYVRGLTVTAARTGEGAGSDHRPVFARVGFGR